MKGYDAYAQKIAMAREIGMDGIVSAFMEAAVWGTPDRILRKLEERRAIVGDFELATSFRFGGTPFDVAESGLRLYAKEVMPVVHSWAKGTSGGLGVERRLHLQDRVDVARAAERPEPIVFTERWVAPRSRHSRARFAHSVGAADPVGEASLDPHGGERAARLLHVGAHALERVARLVTGLELGEPAVGDLGHALEHGLGHAAHPDRDGALDGQRVDAGPVEVMILRP